MKLMTKEGAERRARFDDGKTGNRPKGAAPVRYSTIIDYCLFKIIYYKINLQFSTTENLIVVFFL
jgi:hypothetical protein